MTGIHPIFTYSIFHFIYPCRIDHPNVHHLLTLSLSLFLLGTVGVGAISILEALEGIRSRLLADNNKLSPKLGLPCEKLLPLSQLLLMLLRMRATSAVDRRRYDAASVNALLATSCRETEERRANAAR